MPPAPVPPLKREAVDLLPRVQHDVLTYWQALATLAADVATGSAHIAPEQVPATSLEEWVDWHSHLLDVVFQSTWTLASRLAALQSPPVPPERTTTLARRLEDDAAPTD